jgi:hypothetical protein
MWEPYRPPPHPNRMGNDSDDRTRKVSQVMGSPEWIEVGSRVPQK